MPEVATTPLSKEEAARLVRAAGETCKDVHAVFEDGHKQWEVLFVNRDNEPHTAYISSRAGAKHVSVGVGW